MLTAFVWKILVLGTNQTNMVSGRLVSNHSNTGYPLIFIWVLPQVEYCDSSAES